MTVLSNLPANSPAMPWSEKTAPFGTGIPYPENISFASDS
jgi:hypothetical protein